MSAKNVAVIGANGFIGRQLSQVLLKNQGLNVFLFGRSKTGFAGSEGCYQPVDLLNTAQLRRQLSGKDLVYYLASESIPSSTWNDPRAEVEKNLLPFLNFMECAAETGVKRVVFVSSAGTVYGPSGNKLREDSEKRPFSPYGITKLAMENYLSYYEVKHGISHHVFRVSNVYGEGQDTTKGLGAINTFIEKILTEHSIVVFGDGSIVRNYIYVKDVASLLSFSCFSEQDRSAVYNLSSGDTLSLNDLIGAIGRVVEEKFDVVYHDARRSDNPAIDLDNGAIARAYPDFKFTSLEEGIRNTYLNIKNNLVKK